MEKDTDLHKKLKPAAGGKIFSQAPAPQDPNGKEISQGVH